MSVAQRIARNSLVLLVGQILTYVLSFFVVMYLARYLGPGPYGILSFGLAFAAIFGVVPDLGLSFLTVREVARDKSLAAKYLANVGLMKVILAGVAFGLIALTMNVGKAVIGYPQQTITIIYLLGLSVVITGLNQMCYSIFRAFERMEYHSLGQILHAALMLAGVILAIKYGFGLVGFASLYFYASLVTLAYSLTILVWKFSRYHIWSHLRTQVDWSSWKPTLKQALPFALTLVFASLYYHIDTVMLSAIVSDSNKVVGWYNAAYRLLALLLFIRVSFSMALFPVMSQAHITSKESLKLICERFFKYSVILALPIGVGTTILATRFISMIYGSEYLDSAVALQILVWSAVILYANFTSSLFQAINRQVTVTKIVGFGALLNILLNSLLIPFFGYVGAAAATVVVSAASLAISLALFSRTEYAFGLPFALKNVARLLVGGAVMGLFVWYFQDLNLAILVSLSALVYTMVILLMRTFDSTDFHILTSIVKGEAVLTKLDGEWTN